MKQFILSLSLSFFYMISIGQYVNQFIETDVNTMRNIMNQRQSYYEKNSKYIDNLIDWIFDLKTKTTEQTFLDALNENYNKLKSFEKEDLATISYKIRQVELDIKDEIDKYNTRIRLENERLAEKQKEENDPKKYWDEGIRFLNNKEYYSAIQNFDQVIRVSSDFAGAYYNRGLAYLNFGNFNSAINDFGKFIQLEPNDPNGYEIRGLAKYNLSDYMGAIIDFNKELDLDPSSADAYLNRGLAKSQLDDNYGAIVDYEKAIELQPDYSLAFNNIAWAKFKLKKYREALIDVNKAIDLDNTNYVAYDTRAEIKFNLNDYVGCIRDADIALELKPDIANCYFLKGRVFFKQGKKQDACQIWSTAGELGKKEAYDFIKKYCQN